MHSAALVIKLFLFKSDSLSCMCPLSCGCPSVCSDETPHSRSVGFYGI